MTLRLYDFEFNILGAENNIIKARWTVFYNGVGNFEVHLPLTSKLADVVTENRYIVAVQGGFSAIIVGKEFTDELVLYGRTCNWILTKRLVSKIEKTTVKPNEYAVEVVLDAFSDADNFVSGSIEESEATEFEHNDGVLEDFVVDSLKVAGLGHNVDFDIRKKKWVFNILKGNESDIILSEGHRNAYSAKGSFDIIDLATCGKYREYTDDGYIEKALVKDADKTGIYKWETMLSSDNETEALSELSEKDEKNEITLNVRKLEFGKDYFLGDTVRVQLIKGNYRNTQKRKITGIEIRIEQGVYTEQPIFE